MEFPKEWLEKSDQELVGLSKSNPDFFGVLMFRYKDPLARYIRRISYYSGEDVEDFLQDIFIKVYKNLNDYDESLKFSSWIYRIAHNHIIDQFRKASNKQSVLSLEDNELKNFLKSTVNIEREIADKNCMEIIKKTINDLPLKYREVLVLRFLEDKDYDEIMDILRKPKGTVATLINRGKGLLKEKLHSLKINCF